MSDPAAPPPVSFKHCGKQNPCCMTMQLGVTILAIVDIVMAVTKLILIIVFLMSLFAEIDKNGDAAAEGCSYFISVSGLGAKWTKIIFGIFFGILMIGAAVEIVFGCIILLAARKMNRKLATIWLIVAIIFLVIGFGGMGGCEGGGWLLFAFTIIYFIYRIYMLVCVWFFVQFIKRSQEEAGGPGARAPSGGDGILD